MAAKFLCECTCRQRFLAFFTSRAISTSSPAHKNVRAGVPKITVNKTKGLTYEESQFPYTIGITKSWNSWHTSNLHEEEGAYEAAFEDAIIRKFMLGVWHKLIPSNIIIKRKFNTVVITFLVYISPNPRLYFLNGFTQELLSHYLKRPVFLEIHTVGQKDDMIFKYI